MTTTPELVEGTVIARSDAPSNDAPQSDPQNKQPSPAMPRAERVELRTCNKCGAEYPSSAAACMACGKSQRGRPPGGKAGKASPPPPKPPPTEAELNKLEGGLAEIIQLVTEDILAPRLVVTRPVPKFGETRAARIGAAWAPIIAPYISGTLLLLIFAIGVTLRGFGQYFAELSRLDAPSLPPGDGDASGGN